MILEDYPTLGLCMIVKNESHVIGRCLDSIRRWIDHWTIVDTGSTDGTQSLIRESMHAIPGTLYERPWTNFAVNRSESIQLASPFTNYLLVMDADDCLDCNSNFELPRLDGDAYTLAVHDAGHIYHRIQIIRSSLEWRYEGVLHEYLECSTPYKSAHIEGLRYIRVGGGARSLDPNKFRRDADILQIALEQEPENARYWFYLGQSLRDANDWKPAIEAYERRILLGGWEEETWYALYQVAVCHQHNESSPKTVVEAYERAYQFRPARAEPLTMLAGYLRSRSRWQEAYTAASKAMLIAYPADALFIDQSVYRWRAIDEYAIAAFYLGRFQESLKACRLLLDDSRIPTTEIGRVQANARLALDNLKHFGHK
ncbi:MAG: glycosyltransferase [Pirellulales bacterium]